MSYLRPTPAVGCAVCGAAIRGTDHIVRLPQGTWLHVRCWWDSGLAAQSGLAAKKAGRRAGRSVPDRPRRPAA
jgi:hypothetical protein